MPSHRTWSYIRLHGALVTANNTCLVKGSLLTMTDLNKQSFGTSVSISSSLHALSCSSSCHFSLGFVQDQQTLFPHVSFLGEDEKKGGGGGRGDRILNSSAGHSSFAWKSQHEVFCPKIKSWALLCCEIPGSSCSRGAVLRGSTLKPEPWSERQPDEGGCFSST